MVPAVSEKLAEFLRLCERRRVKSLSLFGSAVSGEFDNARSDIDFLVEFETMTATEHAEAYLSLLEEAETLFGRPVDLVEFQALRNPFVRERVEATREVIYGA